MSSMTTQLPIIPPRQAPPRPKLSINTEQPRILGKGASLRLETLSAVSPTVRNTFSNAYERPSTAPALQRPQRPQLSIESDSPACSSASTPSSAASTLSSTLTSTDNHLDAHSIPYKQPHNLASILSNSPARSSLPRKMNSSRPMFPAEKRVSFRTPIEEEITTTKYTLAHSDIESSCSTLSSIASSASTATTESDAETSQPSLAIKPCKPASETSISPLQLSLIKSSSTTSSVESSPKRSPRTGEKRDSSSSEDDSDSCPETPVAGRRKRTRDWRWTLGPLPSSAKSSASSASSASDAASEDSNY